MARRFLPRSRRDGAATPAAAPPSGGSSALSSLPGVTGTPSAEESRFAQVYAADRVGPMPYANQSSPDVSGARGRVRSLVEELLEGVDEGTGAALDPLIASIVAGWLSRLDSEHADHQAVIDRLVGGARRQLAHAEASHERDRRALEVARRDYHEARERLLEPVEGPSEPEVPPGRHGREESRADDEVYVPPTDPPTGPLPRPVTPGERAPYTAAARREAPEFQERSQERPQEPHRGPAGEPQGDPTIRREGGR